ncbi:helix-turn-helix domain-containing protein [Streptomyces sp. GD-15H]
MIKGPPHPLPHTGRRRRTGTTSQEPETSRATPPRKATRAAPIRWEARTRWGQWLPRQRVGRPRHLLKPTDPPRDQVAGVAGFGTAQSLRRHFRAAPVVTPSTYRRTFWNGGGGVCRAEKLSTACG